MTKLYDQRKTELEIVAKNTIVEIYLIKEKKDEIGKILESKERYLQDVNASLREIDYLAKTVEIEEKKETQDQD